MKLSFGVAFLFFPICLLFGFQSAQGQARLPSGSSAPGIEGFALEPGKENPVQHSKSLKLYVITGGSSGRYYKSPFQSKGDEISNIPDGPGCIEYQQNFRSPLRGHLGFGFEYGFREWLSFSAEIGGYQNSQIYESWTNCIYASNPGEVVSAQLPYSYSIIGRQGRLYLGLNLIKKVRNIRFGGSVSLSNILSFNRQWQSPVFPYEDILIQNSTAYFLAPGGGLFAAYRHKNMELGGHFRMAYSLQRDNEFNRLLRFTDLSLSIGFYMEDFSSK